MRIFDDRSVTEMEILGAIHAASPFAAAGVGGRSSSWSCRFRAILSFIFSIVIMSSFAAERTISGECHLASNEDWTEDTVTLEAGAKFRI